LQALGLALLAAIAAGAVLWFSASYVPAQRRAAIDTWRRELSVVADTRRDLLDRRIWDGLATASFVAAFPSVRALVTRASPDPPGEGTALHLGSILSDFRSTFDERSISIRNAEGLAVASSDGPAPGAEAVAVAREAARSGKARADLIREPDGFVGFVVAAPVRASGPEAGAPGAVLVVGGADKIFDLLGRPVRTAHSSEALIVRKEGDASLHLSPLLFRPDPPLTLRHALHAPAGATREALEGDDVFGSFLDYRGVKVLSARRRLARAPWSLVVKIDEDEALAPVRAEVVRKGLSWGGLLLALIAAAFGLWKSLGASHEATLARIEGRFGALVEQANDGIFLLDSGGRIVQANRNAERMYGRTRDEFLSMHAAELRVRSEREALARDLETVAARGSLLVETRHVRADGSEFPVEVNLGLVKAGGEALYLAIVRDTTERHAAEERIRGLNRLLRTISEVDQLLIKMEDEASLLSNVCRVLVETGGYLLVWIGRADAESMRAVPVARAGAETQLLDSIAVRWDDSPEGHGPFGTAIRTGRHVIVQDAGADPSTSPWRTFASRLGIRSMAVLPLRRHGAVTAALVAYAAVPSFIDGEEVALLDELAGDLSFALDVLDDRETARRSDRELRRLTRAVEQTPATIVITDLEGRIEYVNPHFTEVTGYTADEVRGLNPRILKSDRTSPETIRRLWDIVTAGRVWFGELYNRRKDGTHYWEQASISPVRDEKGAITHYVSVGEDITARKSAEAELARTQQQLLQAQKMEAVGRLAGGVAHDFNNLLTVIQGYGEIVRDSLAGDARKESMEELLKAAGRAASLTRQLLAFSRKQVLEPRIVRLDTIVKETGRMLERLIGEDVALSLVLPGELATVKADPGQIEQVVLNLAVNARDAMPGGGRLTISVDSVDVAVPVEGFPETLPAGRWVRLTVEDTGTGMDAETLEQAFEPFFTTKERGKGTGLGLSTVYGIVRQSDGHVQVTSAPGRGTTFRVYLPRSEDERISGIRPSVGSRRGTETVLVVEDEPAVRSLVQAVLQRKGYTVLVARDGAGALAVLDGHPEAIHALLTDVVMPGMNGHELAALVRSRRPSIRVILMSGYTADVPTELGTEGGPVFLPKPFTEQSLTAKLREALDTPQA
jgi:PAS domain S-box-containing protein